MDISTIKRIFARLRKRQASLPSRGMVKDMGRATSHKIQAVRYCVQNYDLYNVGQKLGNHGLDSIARYIRHFALVAILVDRSASIDQISRIVRNYQHSTGTILPYRGTIHDIGPSLSHKVSIIRTYEYGLIENEIARRTHHSMASVTNYIRAYKNVVALAMKACQLTAGRDCSKIYHITCSLERSSVHAQ